MLKAIYSKFSGSQSTRSNDMAGRFTPPDMDWSSPGDMYKIFKIFKQKCKLIFDGPLDKVEEVKKVTLLLLWIGDKGLEI